uniref:Uncharacterized protein n=1 Tax=Anguilla anguilla TaxID=7936 RepID=A0A0E9V5N1_ANGAN
MMKFQNTQTDSSPIRK